MIALQIPKRTLYAIVLLCACIDSSVAQTRFNEVVVVAPDGQRITIAAPAGITGSPTLTLPTTTSTLISMSGTPNDGDVLTYSSSAGAWQSSGNGGVPAGSVVPFLDSAPQTGYSMVGSFTAASINSWEAKAPLPGTREGPVAAASNDKIYVFSMDEGDAVLEYDPALDTWTSKGAVPDLGNNTGALACAAVNDKIYVFGQFNTSEYDPVADTWTPKAAIPTSRLNASAAALDGMIYLTGGAISGETDIVERFDPAGDSWSTREPMLAARSGHGSASYNGKLYVFGGIQFLSGDFVTLKTVEEYDPVADTWTAKQNMPQERVYFPAVTLNSKIYMLGGLYAENLLGYALDDVDEYDPLTDAWSTRAPLSVETNRAAGAATDGKVYLIGGYDINLTPFTTVEEYSPSVVLYYFVKN